MYKYAFVYRANNINSLKEDLEAYLVRDKDKSYILSQQLELKKSNNIIYINKLDTSEVRVYRNKLIFIIFINKIKDIKEYKFLSKYDSINLTRNQLVSNIFSLGFSNNLTQISMESAGKYGEDKFDLMGNKLFKIDIFDDLGVFEHNSEWNISEYTFQPNNSQYCIKIKSPNRIEFNKRIDQETFEENVNEIINILEKEY